MNNGHGRTKPVLRFFLDGDKYRFKIVQLSDLHLGAASNTKLGPGRDDSKTWKLVDEILKAEKPDFIVLSGDQISANECHKNAVEYYRTIGKMLSQ